MNKESKKSYSDLELEIKKLNTRIECYENALNASNIVSISDLDGVITYANEKLCEVTGYSMDELIGKPHSILRHPDTPDEVFKEMWDTIKSKKTWTGVLKNKRKNGDYYCIDGSISPVLDENDNITHYIAIKHDITEIMKQRKELDKNLSTDAMTGLRNRFKLQNDIKRVNNPSLALININNFREINDLFGHEFGDMVIKEVAKKFENYFKTIKNTAVYRVHGDEFAILNAKIEKNSFIAIIYTLIDELSSEPLSVLGEEIPLKLRASLSFEKDKNILYRTADMVMDTAKQEQKNIVIYNESMKLDQEYENNIKWTKELTKAIKEDRIVPYFQPMINNENSKVEKYECLVRMIATDGDVFTPYHFLNVAKRTEAYLEITKIVMKKSFETFKNSDKEFSINLTIQDITDRYLREFIITNLEEYKIGDRVVFEIVESEGINNFERVIEFIDLVKSYGCKIAIDDFGTGYSNFEYLLRLKADYIKIDASMIKNLDVSEDSRVVVSTIVGFAKKMGMKTVAEFVENETIENIVKDMGIDYCQGYYFGKPEAEPKLL